MTPLAGATRPITDEDLDRWTALGLSLACADLVGAMGGAVQLATAYAAERHQYGAAIGSFQAVQHLLADAFVLAEGARSATLYAAWAVDELPAADALAAAAVAKAYCARAAREVCETVIQVHGGIGNTWECLAHVYLRRCLLSADVLGDAGVSLDRVLEHRGIGGRRWTSVTHPPSRRSGSGCARGCRPTTPACRRRPPTTTTGRAWRRGTGRSTTPASSACRGPRPSAARDWPTVYEVIVDEELAAAGAPPRPSLGYLVQGILEHGSEEIQRRFLPGIVNGRDRWCQGFSEPDAGSDLASLRTRADRDGDDFVITGHKVWTSYSDDAEWCLLLARTDHDVPKHRGISAFAVPMGQPGIEQRPLRMINGVTKEFGEVLFDGARVPGRQHDRAHRGRAGPWP